MRVCRELRRDATSGRRPAAFSMIALGELLVHGLVYVKRGVLCFLKRKRERYEGRERERKGCPLL